jgi:hypothetical protein
VAVDTAYVYYASVPAGYMGCNNNAKIYKVAKAGGTPILMVDSPLFCPGHLLVDDASIYWTESDAALSIKKVAK